MCHKHKYLYTWGHTSKPPKHKFCLRGLIQSKAGIERHCFDSEYKHYEETQCSACDTLE